MHKSPSFCERARFVMACKSNCSRHLKNRSWIANFTSENCGLTSRPKHDNPSQQWIKHLALRSWFSWLNPTQILGVAPPAFGKTMVAKSAPALDISTRSQCEFSNLKSFFPIFLMPPPRYFCSLLLTSA